MTTATELHVQAAIWTDHEDWREAATDTGVVLVFAGHGLGLHEHAGDGHAHTTRHLRDAAEDGLLAAGAVAVAGLESTAAELDGTLARPQHTHQHRPTAGQHRRSPTQRWWSTRIHGHHQARRPTYTFMSGNVPAPSLDYPMT